MGSYDNIAYLFFKITFIKTLSLKCDKFQQVQVHTSEIVDAGGKYWSFSSLVHLALKESTNLKAIG